MSIIDVFCPNPFIFFKATIKADDRLHISLPNLFSSSEVTFSQNFSWPKLSNDASLGLSSHFDDETLVFRFRSSLS